ncbi:unnamed protein product [Miscanthus lutarioriparius]|uniref:t-SNARE coiled-coil homology domain-containing protein n=1 Tax=Miscanthus lutarioriparius TaxID=422564 RepID=A0A811NQY8_9POAL|nr:unnamed protein product [Miscanthus lutarioriparius]
MEEQPGGRALPWLPAARTCVRRWEGRQGRRGGTAMACVRDNGASTPCARTVIQTNFIRFIQTRSTGDKDYETDFICFCNKPQARLGVAGAGASQAVASGVFQINTAVATFQRLVNTLGTPKDTPDLRDRMCVRRPAYLRHKTRQHITQLVKDTSDKLKQASEADHRVEVSATKKIADAKLAKDFQAVLKEFQKAQRLAVEREAAYAPFISQAGLPQSYNSSEVNNGADKLAEQRTQLLESRRQELVFLDNEIVFNEAIIEERDQGIQEIQHQITEVNEIFKDLAVLVHDQGAMIDDIDSHIENAVVATSQAKGQLSKAAKTQKSNSSLPGMNPGIRPEVSRR